MTIKKNQIEDYISDSTQTELDWKLDSVVWWTNITIDNTDPNNPVINWSSAPVDSVNGKTWAVVLDTSDVADTTDARYVTDAEQVVIWNTSWTNTWDQTNVTWNSGTTDALNSATTEVNVSSATAPIIGQVLTATSPTAATWQDAAWGGWGMTLLSTTDVTSPITQIDITSSVFDGTYDWYIVKGYLEADMNWRVFVNFSNNDLSSLLTIGSMHFVAKSTNTTTATSLQNTIWIINQDNTSFSSEPWVWFEMKLNSTVEELRVMWGSSYVDAGFSKVVLDNFTMKSTAWNSMRLYPSAWNFDAWFVSIYWITT